MKKNKSLLLFALIMLLLNSCSNKPENKINSTNPAPVLTEIDDVLDISNRVDTTSLSPLNEKFNIATTDSVTDSIIMNSFKQGFAGATGIYILMKRGNCASVAIIKCAMATYGISGVCKSIIKDDANNQYNITLRDGTTFHLLYSELNQAVKLSGFNIKWNNSLNQKITAQANLYFAILCKNFQRMKRFKSYQHAMNVVNRSQPADSIFNRLGLKAKFIDLTRENITPSDYSTLKTKKNFMFYNTYHAVYASLGKYDEESICRNNQQKYCSQTGIEPLENFTINHGDGDNQIDGAYQLQ